MPNDKVATKDEQREVPCPTCGKPGNFNEFRGTAVEKIIWEGYPAPYDALKPSDK